MDLDNQNISQILQELTTLRDYIRWAYSLFNASHLYFGHGTDNAWDESFYLVLSAVHLPPDLPNDFLGSHLTQVERRTVCDLVLRRVKERLPAAYLTHEAWFAGLPFFVDKRVIIPRSPIAELIEHHFTPWLGHDTNLHILDLCTGSGCIAIACALTFPDSEVTGTDVSDGALEVAKINAAHHHVTDQVRLIRSDLFSDVDGQYDLIISNPPYVSKEEYQMLPDEYRHEPVLALKAEEDGLAIVKQILREAGHYLHDDGILILEVGSSQTALVLAYPDIPFTWLEFANGGEGVLLLTAEQLHTYQEIFEAS